MSQVYAIKPDKKFAQEIIGLGGVKLKQCFQCATCSVVCKMSPDQSPFPRKEMIWAQWGLKDKLVGDPDVWLCHRCSDCSVHCPRGAAPGDVLAAVRDYTIKHYAVPGFLGKAVGSLAMLPIMLIIPAVLLVAMLAGIGHLHIPEGDVLYEHFLPHWPLQIFYGGFAILAFVICIVGARRFWNDMNKHMPPGTKTNGIVPSIIGAAKDIITHIKFKDCNHSKSRYISHLLTFYGFVGLFITTCAVVVSVYVFHYYPLPLFHPLKIFGNLSTIAMVIGVSWIMLDRANQRQGYEMSTNRDWTFVGILGTVVLTGILTEILRYANIPAVAYHVYFVHLIVVFALLMYVPYSRFAHMIYRTVALVHARYSGRETAARAA
ncbi:MAG: quinone-interacting membrane-bound oxidoreductase complex subunit QmoC [Candidatus Latescibacterota bacterium]